MFGHLRGAAAGRPAFAFGRLPGLMIVALLGFSGLVSTALADPAPFATATTDCSNSTVTFPYQSSAHPNVIYSLTSSGASGNSSAADFQSFSAGDEIWGVGSSVDAGTAPTMSVYCSGGSGQLSLYDAPTLPASFTGVASNANTSSTMVFNTLGTGQYVLDASINQGAISVSGPSSTTTIASSGEYPLGHMRAGLNSISLQGLSGPAANYTLSIHQVPVAISNLSFGSQYAATGTVLTGSFSVSGDTTINAYVHNAAGQVARYLGSFAVSDGDSSVTWDTRGDGGASLSSGTYYLHLDSTDPNGNVSSSETSVLVDNTPPSANMIPPSTITPSQSITFADGDNNSGVATLSLLVDGQDVDDFGGYPSGLVPATFSYSDSYSGAWSLGAHTWEIQATDNAGNKADLKGSFTVANPPPPPAPLARPSPPKVTGSNATQALGAWIRSRYGSGLRNYWTCPQQQIFSQQASCVGEFKTGTSRHLVYAQVKQSGGKIKVTSSTVRTWMRRWSRYSRRVIAGFASPGRAQVNTPAYDWAFLAANAVYQHRHHRRTFGAVDYDGPSGGWGRLFDFNCRTHGSLIQCTNSFGDSMKYLP